MRRHSRLLQSGALGLVMLSANDAVSAQAATAPAEIGWNWNPLIGVSLAFAGWRYMDGVWALWRRSGVGRGVTRRQVGFFWAGMATLFIALISPVDALGEVLFSAHMVQHMLLMLVAAPLLVLGMPPVALAWAMPQRWRRPAAQWWHRQAPLQKIWQFITQPLVVWVLFAAVLWGWHLPVLYQAALRDPTIHMIEHASFIGAALLFWWSLPLHGERNSAGYGLGIFSIFTTAMHSSVLGVLLTVGTTVWYPDYALTTAAWGLTPLEDQQLAGLIMWVPSGILFLVAILALLGLWLHRMEHTSQLTAE